jgi:hypothetical protein
MAFDGTEFDTTITYLTDPPTANLTFTGYAAGVFTFTLSSRIYSTNVNISGASVSGFPNTTCTLPVNESDDFVGAVTVIAGNVGVRQEGQTPMTSNSQRYKRVNSITVNGVNKTNGTSITIGGTLVSIVIDFTTCELYAF